MKLAIHKPVLASIITTVLVFLAFVVGLTSPVRADTYNCGAYGAGAYQENVCAASTTTPGSDGGGGLVNTGQSIWAILIAVLLILLGIFVLYRTRKKMKARSSHTPGNL